jgi:hypothetical protein
MKLPLIGGVTASLAHIHGDIAAKANRRVKSWLKRGMIVLRPAKDFGKCLN